jgi:enamine deaminase RidA (YjgF/YER057c/UK114 family)
MSRTLYSSGGKFEPIVGYSRAVKVGNVIEVAGTTSVDETTGEVVGLNDAYAQTNHILKRIQNVLERAGASMKDVVRTRIFTTDISKWEEIGNAHGLFFKDIRPVCTMVEVRALIDKELLVEIEATAIVPN